MKVNGKPQRTIWLAPDGTSVEIIDQVSNRREAVVHRTLMCPSLDGQHEQD